MNKAKYLLLLLARAFWLNIDIVIIIQHLPN